MRLPFKVPNREQLVKWLFSKVVSQFGPLLTQLRDKQLVDDLETLRMLVANLADLSGGPGWVESTQAAIIDIAKQVNTLHEVVRNHHRILEDLKKAEDMWRGGKALTRLH